MRSEALRRLADVQEGVCCDFYRRTSTRWKERAAQPGRSACFSSAMAGDRVLGA